MPLFPPERYLGPSGRGFEILVGTVVAALAVLFIWIGVFVLGKGISLGLLKGPFDKGWLGFIAVPAAFLVLGIPGAIVAFRLLTGRARRDGGLFSPGVLRVSGVLLFLAPLLMLLAGAPWHWWLHGASLACGGVACWILAARRDRRDEPEQAISTPSSRPLN